MAKKIKPSEAEKLYEEFRTNVCVKMRKVTSEDCKFDSSCLSGICLCKWLLKKFNVTERE